MRCRKHAPIPQEVRRTADLLERRWTIAILYASGQGAVRFNEFRQALGGVPPATLAVRLNQLSDAGILERCLCDGRPPRTEYVPTERGRHLQSAVSALLRLSGV